MIKKYNDYINEGVRDKMTPKSEKEIKSVMVGMTPYGMLDKIQMGEVEDDKLEMMAQERVKESEKELDEIVSDHFDWQLTEMVKKVAEWVNKYGGNEENVTGYGFPELAEQISAYGHYQSRHDSIRIYSDEVFKSFKELLKNFAISEVKHNNRDYGERY